MSKETTVNVNNTDLVRALINSQADVEIKDTSGDSVLTFASNKANENIRTNLLYAFSKENKDMVSLLLEAKADIKAGDIKYITAEKNQDINNIVLAEVISRGDTESVRGLIESKNIDIDGIIDNKHTPLTLAVSKGHEDIVRMLLDFKANVDAQDKEGNTALHRAIFDNHGNIVKMLIIDANAQISIKNNSGRCADECAADSYAKNPNIGDIYFRATFARASVVQATQEAQDDQQDNAQENNQVQEAAQVLIGNNEEFETLVEEDNMPNDIDLAGDHSHPQDSI